MNPFEGLPDQEYKCVVVDPPWQYERGTLPGERGVDDQYSATLDWATLRNMPIKDMADDDGCHLWLWYTNAFLEEAASLVNIWGFRVMTQLTWCKPQIGMGSYLRNTTEHCILAKRGHIPTSPDNPKNIPSHFVASRARHSRKPDEAYDIIRAISPGPRIDLFARSPRVGFDRWGNQLLVWDGMKYVESPERFLKAGT